MAAAGTDNTKSSGEGSMSANTNKRNVQKATRPSTNMHNAVDFKSIYVNFVQTAASPVDISIGVGETSPTTTGVIDVEMKARLVMAPLQAKVTLLMLFQVIQQYEKQYGKIAIPSAVSAQMPTVMHEIEGFESDVN
jgi:Protein of unknown function (DUF3467)